ncbi:MAG: HEAT repeat domain-containing protein [Roseiflexaceae bacterium]
MVAFNTVGRFRHPNDLRSLQHELAAEIEQDLALRLLPALLELVLPTADVAGAPCAPADLLRRAGYVTLAGAPGSGRRLAMLQIAHRWATSESARPPTPVWISLPQLDDDQSPPAVLLDLWTQPADSPPAPRARRSALSLLRLGAAAPAPAVQPACWLLLLYGLDELPIARRAAWRAALAEAPERWPDLRMVAAVAHDEPAWPGFTPLTIGSPPPALLRRWIELLAPAEQQVALLEALAPAGPLHTLSERLVDVALLAWLAPRAGLPARRAGLYKRALEAILDVQPAQVERARLIAELQLLAAYGERPSFELPGLLAPKDGGTPRFAYPQARRYLAARQLVEEGRYGLLHSLDQIERDELALLLATMLADPTPLYVTLWRDGHPRAGDVLMLGRCLRERAPASPNWTLRVAGALARLAHDGTPEQRPAARTALAAAAPVLDAALSAAAGAGEAAELVLLRLLAALPDDLAVPRMELLAYDGATPEPLAWELSDRLLALPAGVDRPPPESHAALARWAYLQAARGPHGRQLLAPVAVPALAALAGSAAGAPRRRRAATALLDEPSLPVGAQVAALELLGDNEHPAAAAVIERAIHDQSAEIQRHAIATLAAQTPDHALAALSQTIVDDAAPWEARLSAILHLGEQHAPDAAVLLERCTRDTALPLYVRIQAVAALERHDASLEYLVAIAGDTRCQPEVRATAVRWLGVAGHLAALDDLLGLLYDPAAPAGLAEAICDALGALGASHGQGELIRDTLLHIIEAAGDDVALTLAAVRALGLLGDAAAVEPLSRLLGVEARERLQRGPHKHLLQQTAEACLDSPDLPATMALRLASACAEGTTPADRPTTLAEFLMSEADLLRASAAASLAAIGGGTVRAAILEALIDGSSGGATDELIATMAEADGDGSAETLGQLIVAAEANPLTRWLAVRHLADHPDGEQAMRQVLARADVDAFTRGALAEALGQRGDPVAIPLLLQIADDHAADMHLRAQALLALGLLNRPDTEPALMRLISNPAEDDTLRGLAAEHLPSALSDQGRRQLRDMLRRERVPAPIVAGTLRTLERARDRESLPLLLRYAQDETAEIAQAAIGALAELGDSSITPDLVRTSQNPAADRAVRLEAVGALLRLGGTEFRSLLRGYLEQGALPLRLQALEHLIAASETPDELLALLADRSWPLLLRLRVIERLGDSPQAPPVLLGIVQDHDDDIHLRCLAAELIGRTRHAPALAALIALAERDDITASVRLQCINTIGAIGGSAAWLLFSHLAEDETQMPTVRHWATMALRRIKE